MEEADSNPSVTSNQNQENEVELSLQVIIVPNNEQLNSLHERTKKSPKLLKSKAAHKSCSIFRVPPNILELHPRSFQPGIVSIGPYYHGEQRLQMMQEHKCRILGFFLDQIIEFGIVLDHLYQSLKEKEDQIRVCYSQNIDQFSSDQLIEMMILDGCFIILLLCVVGRIIIPESDDPIFNFPWMQSSITRDLLMLENQIPFFVLQILYDISVADFIEVPSLQELILTLINYSLPRYGQVSKLCDKYNDFCGEHILDFYRSTYIPSSEIDDGGHVRGNEILWSWCCCCPSSTRKEKTTTRGDSLQSSSKEEAANERVSLLSSSIKESITSRRNSRIGETSNLEKSLKSLSKNKETAYQGDSLELLSKNEETANDKDSLLSASVKEITRSRRNSGNGENMNLETTEQHDSSELLQDTANDRDSLLSSSIKETTATDRRNSLNGESMNLEKSLSKHEEATDQGDSMDKLSENEETRDVVDEPRGWTNKLCELVGIRLKGKVETSEDLLQFIQPVEKLLQAGIKFKKREGTDSFLDIDFSRGALRIPLLVTGETMSTLILNSIAFEQCYKHRSKHFISYFNFMGYLINTTYDAGYLREKKIIENFFGTDQELVNFFNEVGKNIPYYFKEDYLIKVAEKVEIYYRNAWHVRWAEFKYTYCGSVWVCLSASAALLVILLTALQTFYALYAYHNPS